MIKTTGGMMRRKIALKNHFKQIESLFEFEIYGELFFVHKNKHDRFDVSHVLTGFSATDRPMSLETVEAAAAYAKIYNEKYGKKKMMRVIEKANKYIKDNFNGKEVAAPKSS